jgi:hypothetical protein
MNQTIAQIHAFFKSILKSLIMTNGKQSTMRYRILHACLRAMRYRYIKELIEKMTGHDLIAEKRSVERDFETQRIRSAHRGSYAGQGVVEQVGRGCRLHGHRISKPNTMNHYSPFMKKYLRNSMNRCIPRSAGTYPGVRGAPHR